MILKKVITSTVALSLLTVSVMNTTVAVSADTVTETQNAINTNKNETDKLLKDIAAANADNIKLQEKITANTEKIAKLKSDIDHANEKIDKLNGQIEEAKVEVAQRTETLKGQLVALQKKSGDTISGNVYLDFVINSENFSDLVARTFAVNKLNHANKEALNAVQKAKDQYTTLLHDQEQTKADLQADKAELEAKQKDLEAMKVKSDQQQADLNKKIDENKETLLSLQKDYEEAADAVKQTQDKANATSQTGSDKKDGKGVLANAGSISQGDGSTHGIVAGNSYPWGQCTWYVKQVAPWAGNYWGNGGQWGSSAAAAGFRVDHSPAAGSIIVFLPGQSVGGQWTADGAYGHVAYVEAVNGNSVTISQGGMGFSNPAGPNTQTISGAGSYIYIHR